VFGLLVEAAPLAAAPGAGVYGAGTGSIHTAVLTTNAASDFKE